MSSRYNHKTIEKNGKKAGQEKKFQAVKNLNKKKYYVLEMFPYPSGKIYGKCEKLYDLICRCKI